MWLHPYGEVLESVVGFLGAVGDVHQIGVGDVAAKIPERVAKLIVIFCEQRLDGFQLRLAPRVGSGGAGKEEFALLRDEH